jgi:hypothetical protein
LCSENRVKVGVVESDVGVREAAIDESFFCSSKDINGCSELKLRHPTNSQWIARESQKDPIAISCAAYLFRSF